MGMDFTLRAVPLIPSPINARKKVSIFGLLYSLICYADLKQLPGLPHQITRVEAAILAYSVVP